ncbi:helicase-related protein [Streptomyces alkaliphilus]|uniref:helicase-related protein n=1 Tax=Streptomyces alkaliphilus TaxID=1472722 RepID=UPI001E476D2E|nr:helicase-related protein [Streptomyces alkaliphilus]
MEPARIRRASVGRDKRRVRNMIAATPRQVREAALSAVHPRGGPTVMVLEGGNGRLRPLDPERDLDTEGDTDGGPRTARAPHDAAFVLVDLADDRGALDDRCPACRTRNAIRYLGTGLAPLAAAAITQLFTGGELDPARGENKTLLFNDSVQDAAHRAGYVASRSYTFSLRSLLAARIDEDEPIALNDLAADLISDVVDSHSVRAAVIPPDLHVVPGVDTLLSGRGDGSRATWDLIAQRLTFATVMEFGLRSRQGRTLELTRTVAADVPLADPDAVADLVRELLHTTPGDIALPDGSAPGPREWVGHVRGLLERLRQRGAIRHAWLDPWLHEAGVRRWQIWGGRRTGMPAFPPGISAPSFLLDRPKQGSDDFDVVTGRLGWYRDWARRSLGLGPDAAGSFLSRLLPALVDTGVICARTARDGVTRVHGLQPGHVRVRRLADHLVAEAAARCETCSREQTIHPDLADQWHDLPCPRYRCPGRLRVGEAPGDGPRSRDYTTDFYRRMYREAGVYTINTAEHTGTLSRARREAVERAFREGTAAHYANPQVLSCTPTLELGIDIGDLSAVVLASLPKGPANYVQRVGRAGRADGNAYLLTLVDRRPRDRYYLEDPRQMIAGDIRPPGCYLSAVEILRRQYLAHLLDLAAAGRLTSPADGTVIAPMPHRATDVLDGGTWLPEFLEAVRADGERLAARFLDLFPAHDPLRGTGVDPRAARELAEFAGSGLTRALETAREDRRQRRAEVRERMTAIDTALGALVPGDPEHARRGRDLRAERRELSRQARETGRATAHGALVEAGLLPNYSLIDTTTELEATLLWREEKPGGEPEHHSRTLRYERAARFALEDFAPGNHFYVQGYRHRVTGLEIGTRERPAWRWWRICPDCGHVRTRRPTEDTSPCPRCESAAIGDVGCLHRILVPRRVTSRDRRDDIRVRDETEERERRAYTVVPTVDIDDRDIESGYLHRHATFGWEFTRRAVIRHINVGASRTDPGAEEAFAGRRVRLNPFWVCDRCGHADPDGGPDGGPGAGTGTDERDRARRPGSHHRPWCPLLRPGGDPGPEAARRGVRLLLAHELESDALRLLIPAVTAHTAERLATFKAVLLAGIAHTYGGDPDHLDIITTSAPDDAGRGDGGMRRHHLVLHDTLPRGTGYLHRLADPDGLREVLLRAREVIETCSCAGRERPACHLCLLRHVEGDEYGRVSRGHALDILGELLGPDGSRWEVRPSDSTRRIDLARQVESELEALFRHALLEWAERADEASVRDARTPDGERDTVLRLTAPDGTVRGWRVETQVDLGFTVPDLVFRGLDDDRRVAVYLDGYRYHASTEHNRIAEDAERRARLRGEGWRVFQLTWDDVRAWAGHIPPPTDPAWEPYHHTGRKTAADVHRRLHGGDPRELPRLVWTNPVASLIGHLTDPDPTMWRRCVHSTLAGFAAVSATSRALADGQAIADRIGDALHGRRLSGGAGGVHVMATRDASGCPLTIVLDLRRGQAAATWTALTVLDDSPRAITSDEAAHRARWRAWLYWSNLLQFLDDDSGGEGVQLAGSDLPGFDPLTLAVTGGAGWITGHRAVPQQGPAAPPAAPVRDPDWEEVLAYLVDEPGLAELAEELAARGTPAPVAGHELGAAGWVAELAWPDHGVGVVLAPVPGPDGGPDVEARDRDAAYAAAGWRVAPATGWNARELAGLLTGPVAPDSPARPVAGEPATEAGEPGDGDGPEDGDGDGHQERER